MLQSRGWARGTNTTYAYNAAGELTGIDYSDVTPDVTFTYDRRGRQTGITQGGANTTQLFNDAGQLLSQTANGLTVSNSYDLYFRRTNSGVWNGSAWLTQTEYTYDNASRLQKIGDGTNSATYAYLANSSLIDTITFKENATTRMTTTKTWDNLNRLKKIESVAGGSTVSSHAYAYNSANQRTSVTNAENARWVYQYDKLGQVTSGKKYWSDGTPVAGQQFEYSFDDIGNRNYAGEGGNEWGTGVRYSHYTVNTVNQYTQRTVPGYVDVLGTAKTNSTVTVNDTPTYRKLDYFRRELPVTNNIGPIWISVTNLAVLKDGANPDIATNLVGNLFVAKNPEPFTYDFDGNQTSDGRWTNRWDAENRLIAVESHSTSPDGAKRKLVFGYDWQGRRTSKIVSNFVAGSWVLASNVRFVYDQWNLLAEVNATNNAVINSYMWGLDLSGSEHGAGGVGGLLAIQSTGNGTHFYSFDGNGNVTTLTSSTNGATTGEYEYDPFLNPLRATGQMANLSAFTGSGKYWDQEIGYYYFGLRYLRDGRWVSRDLLEEAGGRNLIAFDQNDMVNAFDALGLFKESSLCTKKEIAVIQMAESGARTATADAIVVLATQFTVKELLGRSPKFKARWLNDQNFRDDYHAWYRWTSSNLREILRGLAANEYGVECECFCAGKSRDAYVRPGSPIDSDVHFCPSFFKDPIPSRRTGTFLHEVSHLFAGTDDLALGSLAPWVENADDAYFYDNIGNSGATVVFGQFINFFSQRYGAP